MEKQFLLVVRNVRGFPRFQLMAVATNYDTLNDPNVQGSLAAGAVLSLQLTEPNGTTCTINVEEP
jgi:hypothetical protein